ncbi:MAG: hypothetical protein HC822_03755 [Oscillochloris sp.]|nr:hypothetical protein [Oscillochloris sp.]
MVDGDVGAFIPAGAAEHAGDSRMVYSSGPVCTASNELPDGIAGMIGAPVDIQITAATVAGDHAWGAFGIVPADPALQLPARIAI